MPDDSLETWAMLIYNEKDKYIKLNDIEWKMMWVGLAPDTLSTLNIEIMGIQSSSCNGWCQEQLMPRVIRWLFQGYT